MGSMLTTKDEYTEDTARAGRSIPERKEIIGCVQSVVIKKKF